MYKVLLTERIDKTGIDILSKVAQVDIAPDPSEKTIVSMVGEYDAMIIRATLLTEPMLAAGKKLKVVGRHGVGTDNLDIPAATRHGILLLNTPGANAGSVAEYTVGALLYLFKRFAEADRMLRRGDFNQPGSLPPEALDELIGRLKELDVDKALAESQTAGGEGRRQFKRDCRSPARRSQ